MRIDAIIPYKRNARHNEKAIPVVAESIKEFGLRGQIVLESREHPVIVTGHTRVAACKLLGWTEIPDEHIAFCDGLTEEQIKAYRIADNKTGEVATWNISMLKSEVKSMAGIDMSRYGCDFKSKHLPYGAERLKTDDAYNLDKVNRDACVGTHMPALRRVDVCPYDLQGFNYAKSTPDDLKRGKGCHFFVDDYQFERLWVNPERYLQYLKAYDCVLTPDFSLYMDMPDAMQRWNRYRSQALGRYWQEQGLTVVPTLSWAQPSTFKFCFDGIPRGGTVATSTVGVRGNKSAMTVWQKGMRMALNLLEPTRVLLYGGEIEFDFGGCEVVPYTNSVTERIQHGR